MKFRRKPMVIDAVQFNKFGDHPSVFEDSESPTGYGIFTLESTLRIHEVSLGDWIITGVEGEVYACKPHIFVKIYEPVEEGDIHEEQEICHSRQPVSTGCNERNDSHTESGERSEV